VNYRTAAHEAIAKSFNSFRPLGYIPDADHKRWQKNASLLYGTTPTVPPRASLTHLEAPTIDQGQTEHCTGAGTSQAAYVSAAAGGSPLPFVPSPRFFYSVVRILERPDASQPLTDSGAMPSDLLTVLRQYGAVPLVAPTPDGRYDDVWGPDDLVGLTNPPPPNVNDEVSLLDLEKGGLKIITGEYRIDEKSLGAVGQIQASIAGIGGAPAAGGIGIFVDTTNFMQWDPAQGPIKNIDLSDPQGGGHWLALTYYYTTAAGLIVFGGPNSWSKRWPTASAPPPESPYWTSGHYEITASCLQSVMSDCLLFPVKVLS
jgi:hypothetical protein